MRSSSLALGFLLAIAACGPPPAPPVTADSGQKQVVVAPDSAKVTAFSVDSENLLVDKIAMRDGGIRPDGNRDLVFRATVEGPVDALYLVTTDEKGIPLYGFRADTIAGHEELPPELGSVVDVGRLTVWIAVVEDGKFINTDGGALGTLAPGAHQLKLYVPNTGNLAPKSH